MISSTPMREPVTAVSLMPRQTPEGPCCLAGAESVILPDTSMSDGVCVCVALAECVWQKRGLVDWCSSPSLPEPVRELTLLLLMCLSSESGSCCLLLLCLWFYGGRNGCSRTVALQGLCTYQTRTRCLYLYAESSPWVLNMR